MAQKPLAQNPLWLRPTEQADWEKIFRRATGRRVTEWMRDIQIGNLYCVVETAGVVHPKEDFHERVPYGEETSAMTPDLTTAPVCSACGVLPGMFHNDASCVNEECPICREALRRCPHFPCFKGKPRSPGPFFYLPVAGDVEGGEVADVTAGTEGEGSRVTAVTSAWARRPIPPLWLLALRRDQERARLGLPEGADLGLLLEAGDERTLSLGEEWRERLEDVKTAQGIAGYRLGDTEARRVPFGEETYLWEDEECRCGVRKGQLHMPGCDYEMCGRCEGQVIACACPHEFKEPKDPQKPKKPVKWVSYARRFGGRAKGG
jgi:hypothetical protein